MITYIYAVIALLITLGAHILGMHGLYMQYPWYDIFMHILGGVGIGLFLTAFVKSNLPNLKHRRTKVITGVFIAGLIWELIEVHYDIAGEPLWTKAYYLDTLKDLIDDTIGGALVAWLSFRKR